MQAPSIVEYGFSLGIFYGVAGRIHCSSWCSNRSCLMAHRRRDSALEMLSLHESTVCGAKTGFCAESFTVFYTLIAGVDHGPETRQEHPPLPQ